jgi:uncharacterized protein YbjQ (UPF0145 family)
MEGIVQLGLFVAAITVGWLFGRANERRHLRELARAEARLRDIVVLNGRWAQHEAAWRGGTLVVGSVVIAEDYFKRIAATLRSFVGGPVRSYESLVERGRREAVVRMKTEARKLGATLIANVRLETASLAEDRTGRGPMFSAEFIAYGSALVAADASVRRRDPIPSDAGNPTTRLRGVS